MHYLFLKQLWNKYCSKPIIQVDADCYNSTCKRLRLPYQIWNLIMEEFGMIHSTNQRKDRTELERT